MNDHIGGIEGRFKYILSRFTGKIFGKPLHQRRGIPSGEGRHQLGCVGSGGNRLSRPDHPAGKHVSARLPHHRSKDPLEQYGTKVAGGKDDHHILPHQGLHGLGQFFVPPGHHGDDDQITPLQGPGQIVGDLPDPGKAVDPKPGHLHASLFQDAVNIFMPIGLLLIKGNGKPPQRELRRDIAAGSAAP